MYISALYGGQEITGVTFFLRCHLLSFVSEVSHCLKLTDENELLGAPREPPISPTVTTGIALTYNHLWREITS